MAQFIRTDNAKLLPNKTLDWFKYEVAKELGLLNKIETQGWGEMRSRECGVVGGHIGGKMVRVMIKIAEEALARGEKL